MPRPSRGVSKRERYDSIEMRPSSQSGTYYPCHSSYLRNLIDPDAPFARVIDLTTTTYPFPYATRKLQDLHNRPPSEKAHAALRRLHDLDSLIQSGEWFADLPFKIFADCDVGLFDERLKGMVFLEWYDSNVEVSVLGFLIALFQATSRSTIHTL